MRNDFDFIGCRDSGAGSVKSSRPGRWRVRAIAAGALFCLLFPADGTAATLKIGGTGSAIGTVRLLAGSFVATRPGVTVQVPDSLGSGGGIKAVTAGALDIGLSSRPLKARERDAGARETVFARTPFILVTSNSQAKPDLTSARVTEIFTGAATSWSDGRPVRIVLRPEDDSNGHLLVAAFTGMRAALAKARGLRGIPVAFTDQEAMEKAEAVPGSLTTATLAAVVSEKRRLTPVAIDGVSPTLANLANGSYRHFKTLYLVTGPTASQLARDFIGFVLSDAGAEILRNAGSMPL